MLQVILTNKKRYVMLAVPTNFPDMYANFPAAWPFNATITNRSFIRRHSDFTVCPTLTYISK